MKKILISACLCGLPCRYDGMSRPNRECVELAAAGRAVPFCPEMAGGLSCPRIAAEIHGGSGKEVLAGTARVTTRAGEDVTAAYIAGAESALEVCRAQGITRAWLKTRSPSCGGSGIHDGSFTRKTRPGDGVTAALLRQAGIQIQPTDRD